MLPEEFSCFYICHSSKESSLEDIYLFHLCAPAWFAKLSQNEDGLFIEVIQLFSTESDRWLLEESLEDAKKFVRRYFHKG